MIVTTPPAQVLSERTELGATAYEPRHETAKARRMRRAAVTAAVLVVAAIVVWASDRITLEGERVIYAAQCDGLWTAKGCNGHLRTASRLVYTASKRHSTVERWLLDSDPPTTAIFSGCNVHDRDNWACADNATGGLLSMEHGRLVSSDVHALSKWRWWMLHLAGR